MAVNDQEKAANERIARLYRDAAHEEPASHLDAAIRRAASGPSRSAPARAQSWWASWRLPFTFAAVVAVSVSLVTLMLEEGGERLTREAQTPPVEARERPAQAQAPRPVAPPEGRDQGALRDSPPAAPGNEQARRRGRSTTLQENAEARKSAPPPAALQEEHAAPAAQAPLDEAATAGSPDVALSARPGEGGTPAPAHGTSPDAGPAAGRSAAPAAQPAPAPRAATPMRKADHEAARSAKSSAEIAKLEGEPPAVWVDRILLLKREGRDAEATALLAQFKSRFPGATLPPELR